jgi:hypothetical protein
MRLPNAEFTSRPRRIHELAPDFRLEDAYMAAIRLCRHVIIYPTMLREGERTWRSLAPTRPPGVPT